MNCYTDMNWMCRMCWAVSAVCRHYFLFWRQLLKENALICCPPWRILQVLPLLKNLKWMAGKYYLPAPTQVSQLYDRVFFSLSEYQFSLLINFLILLLIMVLKPYSLQLMIMIHRLLFYFRNESCIECYVYRRKFNYSDCLLNLESALQLFFWNVDWKLEQNPVSGFLSLLRNVLHRHPRNTEQLLEGSNIAIIGSLMQKVTIHSYTVMLNISTITSFWLW